MKWNRFVIHMLLVMPSIISLRQPALGQGTAFTYQGRLNDGSSPANGNYDMQFYLRSAATGGSPVGNTNTLAPVPASNGLFTVALDFGPGIFAGSPLWLEIGVRTNGSLAAYTTLSGRQQLTPSPYALYSPQAGGVTNGAITSTMLANAAVTTSKLATGAVTSITLSNSIGLGSSNVAGRLDVFRNSAGSPAISLVGSGSLIETDGSGGSPTAQLGGTSFGALSLKSAVFAGNPTLASLGGGNIAAGGDLSLFELDGTRRADLNTASSGAMLRLYQTNGGPGVSLVSGDQSQLSFFSAGGRQQMLLGGRPWGEISLREIYGSNETVRLSASDSVGGSLLLNNSNGVGTVLLDGSSSSLQLSGAYLAGKGGNLGLGTGNPQSALQIEGQIGAPPVSLPGGQGGLLLGVSGLSSYKWIQSYNSTPLALNPLGNNVGIGVTNPAAALHVKAGQAGPLFETTSSGNGSVLQLKNDVASPTLFGAINFVDNNNNTPIQLAAYGNGDMALRAGNAERVRITSIGVLQMPRSSDGAVTLSMNADDGTGHSLITTSVIQITGGSDLSEQFDVRDVSEPRSAPRSALTAGMVVCIDPGNPGQLVVSSKPYDRTVAGVLSGAGGIKPGMVMGQQATLADGKHAVALTGRVYCYADASNGPIQPGDLLTTSATPGHAMKATDPALAQGAVLGKAMGSLANGTGLVLVLVTLQ
jgi:hypothetical protein